MNIISSIRQSAISFTNSIPEISARNKKIALIAAAVFGLIGIGYTILRCCKWDRNEAAILRQELPGLQRLSVEEDDRATELTEDLNKKIEKAYQFSKDGFSDVYLEFDKQKNELDAICKRFDNELASINERVKKRTNALEQAFKAMQQKIDDLEANVSVQVKNSPVQIKQNSDDFSQTFNDNYCTVEPAVHGQFPNGIKLDDQLSDSLQQLVSKYPNLRFYFNWNTGSPDREKFEKAVRNGPNDAIWCFVIVKKTDAVVPQQPGEINGVIVFNWIIALNPKLRAIDNVLSTTDDLANYYPYEDGFLADLKVEKNRSRAMNSTRIFNMKVGNIV